ncbi:MAG: acetyl-CoA carboxylase biotin carboxyl carrier protein [Bacteriovoracia bacterium]
MAAKSKTGKTTAPKAKSGGAFDYDHLEKLFKLLNDNGIADFEWEKNGERLSLRTLAGAQAQPANLVSTAAVARETVVERMPAPVSALSGGDAKPVGGLPTNQKQILSPFVGTFYRSPSPDQDPYVKEGQSVKRGDVLCIVEAMKLMNEIEAEISGKIVSILVENGQPVEFGEPLFVVET